MACAVRVAPDRDAAAVNRRLDDLVVMREMQRTARLQVAEVSSHRGRTPDRTTAPRAVTISEIQEHVVGEIRGFTERPRGIARVSVGDEQTGNILHV
mgnify:CR=1 FL=1